jgi:hypothetical protein
MIFRYHAAENPDATIQWLTIGSLGNNYVTRTATGTLSVQTAGGNLHTSPALTEGHVYGVALGFTVAASGAPVNFLLRDYTAGSDADTFASTTANTGTTNPTSAWFGKSSTGGNMAAFRIDGLQADTSTADLTGFLPAFPATGGNNTPLVSPSAPAPAPTMLPTVSYLPAYAGRDMWSPNFWDPTTYAREMTLGYKLFGFRSLRVPVMISGFDSIETTLTAATVVGASTIKLGSSVPAGQVINIDRGANLEQVTVGGTGTIAAGATVTISPSLTKPHAIGAVVAQKQAAFNIGGAGPTAAQLARWTTFVSLAYTWGASSTRHFSTAGVSTAPRIRRQRRSTLSPAPCRPA